MSAIHPSGRAVSPPDNIRRQYAQQMMAAFQQQAMGKTNQAFCTFRNAYQLGLQNGESPAKLAAINHLFVWYQHNGQSCGVARVPSDCSSERGLGHPTQPLRQLDPKQERLVQSFLLGAGEIIGGVFCIVVPGGVVLGSVFGTGLIADGARNIYSAVCDMNQDARERAIKLGELREIEKEAIYSSK
jgi:hypothetical protein